MANETSKEKIVKIIIRMSRNYSAGIVFTDWVTVSALAIQNSCYGIHDDIWKEREASYLSIMKKYGTEEQKQFAAMFRMLADALENERNP